MRSSNLGRFHQQVRFLQRQFLQDGDLCSVENLWSENHHVVGNRAKPEFLILTFGTS